MLALQVTSLKNFMNALLAGDLFDIFLLEEALIATAATYTIDGRINKDFYTTEEWNNKEEHPYEFTSWQKMKSTCFNLIKGKRTPLQFKFVFQLMPVHTASIFKNGNSTATPDLIKAFVVTVKYDGEKVILCTGTSYTTFVMDKEPEKLWDAAFQQFLYKKGIACEVI
ncbi:MAG TPA: DUF5721 family protein [Lachnospiraceae bacterium]|nr:DUF5721 family protein [Lachnospiraceae bacterium]